MKEVLGYAAQSAKDDLAPFHVERREPRSDDVVIEILYCGVCHSDLHQVRNDWGFSQYPMIPGHEIIGRVSFVGNRVTKVAVGDYVGVGNIVDTCRVCQPCQDGLEQFCAEAVPTYNGHDRHDHLPTYGGYSESITCAEDFVLKIPAGLDIKKAAPLLCAGITTWSPLRHWHVTAGSKVAVIGLGGLGHMTLKLASALGAEVSLFSRSPNKENDAKALGAHQFVLSTDEQQMAAVHGKFDLIIDTVPNDHDINPYLPTLTLNGTLVFVGYIGGISSVINTVTLMAGRRSIAGSCIGGIAETQEMLNFCAAHGIGADVEMIDIRDINRAFERMEKSDVKYRFVIDMATLTSLS